MSSNSPGTTNSRISPATTSTSPNTSELVEMVTVVLNSEANSNLCSLGVIFADIGKQTQKSLPKA